MGILKSAMLLLAAVSRFAMPTVGVGWELGRWVNCESLRPQAE
jgi:hypothetical protein